MFDCSQILCEKDAIDEEIEETHSNDEDFSEGSESSPRKRKKIDENSYSCVPSKNL